MATDMAQAKTTATSAATFSRTRAMIEEAIVPTLLRLAAPNLIWIISQAIVSIGETYFVGWLGAEALAGVSLVFPVLMLMQTTAGGGVGGGVASAIARALGGGRREDANALVLNSLAIAVCFGLIFTVAVLLGGPALFKAMGGTGEALRLAGIYAGIIFSGALLFWVFNIMGSILRGAGVMSLPAMVSMLGAVITLTVSPALILGFGPVPGLGLAGAAIAILAYYALGVLILGAFLLSGRAPVRPLLRAGLEWRLCREVLRVGLLGALNTVVFNSAVLLATPLVGPFGIKAIAGYGMGARLEYLQVPIVFGLGTALTTMVGTNVGAGLEARAKRVAWTGAAIAGCVCGGIGLIAAIEPHLWLDIFSQDPDVFDAGMRYLRIVGPSYSLYGIGLALYFASQGAGRLAWPVGLGCGRLVLASAGGALSVYWLGGGLDSIYASLAAGLALLGGGTALAVRFTSWRR